MKQKKVFVLALFLLLVFPSWLISETPKKSNELPVITRYWLFGVISDVDPVGKTFSLNSPDSPKKKITLAKQCLIFKNFRPITLNSFSNGDQVAVHIQQRGYFKKTVSQLTAIKVFDTKAYTLSILISKYGLPVDSGKIKKIDRLRKTIAYQSKENKTVRSFYFNSQTRWVFGGVTSSPADFIGQDVFLFALPSQGHTVLRGIINVRAFPLLFSIFTSTPVAEEVIISGKIIEINREDSFLTLYLSDKTTSTVYFNNHTKIIPAQKNLAKGNSVIIKCLLENNLLKAYLIKIYK